VGQHDHLVAQHPAPRAVQRRTPSSLASVPAAFAAIQRSAGNRAATTLAMQRQAADGLDVQRIACSGGNCGCAGCGGGGGEEKQQGEGS
jgi:hypothetical protein